MFSESSLRNRASVSIVFLLTLAFLMTMPSYTQVRAVTSPPNVLVPWSPFGPAVTNQIIYDFSDFPTMFNAFQNGQVDITDWPIPLGNIVSFCSNIDIFCTQPEPELGIFQADINNHAPFLGRAMETVRPALVGSVANVVSGTSSACTTGNGQLTLSVVNIEAGGAFKDSLNQITIANQPSGIPASLPTNDQGGSSPTGTYVFPCILAGTYLITGSIVTGNATTGTRLSCGSPAGCTVSIPPGSGGLGGTVSATWNVVWNSPSSLTPTAAFPNIMKALAHLIDKPEFVQHDPGLNGNAICDDIMLSPSHLIPGSPCVARVGQLGTPFPSSVLTRECSSISLDTIITSCNPVSAYNLVDDNIGSSSIWWGVPGRSVGVATGYSGPADIDAACQFLQHAGFNLTGGTANTCAELAQDSIGTTQPASYPRFTAPTGTHFLVAIRSDPPRHHFGQVIADSINMLFGTPNDSGTCSASCSSTDSGTATVLYEKTVTCPIFGCEVLQPKTATIGFPVCIIIFVGFGPCLPDKWNMYTGSFLLGPTPDFLFSNFHSQFASQGCGGPANSFPPNYVFHCDPGFDAIANAGEFQSVASPTLSASATIFSEAAGRTYDVPINIPVYSRIQQFAALNGWNWRQVDGGTGSSLVPEVGHGFQRNFWAAFNMKQVPGYVPASTSFAPGGGNPNLIRHGFSQDPDTLNPYQATTNWDLEIVRYVFDTLLQVNPRTAGANQQVIEWTTSSHQENFNPLELGCIAGPSVASTICVKGITTQTWHLRSDLFFHDGSPVTAQDVVYSILTARDDFSANFFTNAAFVTNAVALDSKTVQVKLELNSAYYEQNIGSVPIVPKHLWEGPNGSICGSISAVSTPAGPVNVIANGPQSECASDPAFDPLTCTGTAGPIPGCGTTFADGSVQGIFTGSGPWACKNAGPSTSLAFSRPGGSCVLSSAGALIGGTSFSPGARMLLSGYTNYMRGLRGGQGNSLQKQSWADYNDDGVVNILDASNAAFFFDSSNGYWAHPEYSCNHSAPVVDICGISALSVDFDQTLTGPPGPPGSAFQSTLLLAEDPQVDPYSTQLSGSNTCLYYQTATTTTAQMLLLNCGSSTLTGLPSGHSLTIRAAVLNSDGTLGAITAAGFTINGGVVNVGWAPGLTPGTSYEIKIYDNMAQIAQYFVTL